MIIVLQISNYKTKSKTEITKVRVRISDLVQALAATDNVEQSKDYVTLIKECADAIISLRKADQQS